MTSASQRALYNNPDKDEGLALVVDAAIQSARMDGWRDNTMKTKKVRIAIRDVVNKAAAEQAAVNRVDSTTTPAAKENMVWDNYAVDLVANKILELAKHQNDY